MKRIKILIVGCLMLGFGVTSCVTPKPRMVGNDLVGQHTVKYLWLLHQSGGGGFLSALLGGGDDGDEDYYDLIVEVCDVTDAKKETKCERQPILKKVDRTPDKKMEDQNAVTALYWDSTDMLYVGYAYEKTPRVMKCKVQADNSVTCKDQPAVGKMLETIKSAT